MKTLSSYCFGMVLLLLALSSSAQDCNLTNPQNLPWVQELISTQNCGCNEYLEHHCYENESIFILGFSSPFCLDYTTSVYDANGNIICILGGLLGGTCDEELPNLGNSEYLSTVWSCNNPFCICTDEYDPVCGVDGQTYGNACEAACEGVEILYNGACDNGGNLCGAESVYDLPWLSIYIEDCHYDHIYSFELDGQELIYVQSTPMCPGELFYIADIGNILFDCSGNIVCYLGGEQLPTNTCPYSENDVYNQLTPGNLVWPLIPEPCICPEVYAPVCGVDGQTYGNACEAACEGVEVLYDGPCNNGGNLCGAESVYDLPWLTSYIDNCHYDAIYSFEYQGQQMIYVQSTPICPGETAFLADLGDYLFDCEGNIICLNGGFTLQESQCSFQGIDVSSFINSQNLVWPLIPEPCICPAVYAPVCGVDGQTYGNSCEAACEGVEILYNGACDSGGNLCGAESVYDLPWLATYIENCHYPNIYSVEVDGQELVYVQSSPMCPGELVYIADLGDILFDCSGNVVCYLGGELIPTEECAALGTAVYNQLTPENLVWTSTPEPCICPAVYAPVCGSDGITYGNACEAACAGVEVLYDGMCNSTSFCDVESVYDLPWLSPYIDINNCHNSAVYAFEYNGQQMVYTQHSAGCFLDDGSIIYIADLADVLFDCEGNVICLNGGFTTPESQCSFDGIDISSFLINDNLVWTPLLATSDQAVADKILLDANIYLQGAFTNSTDDLMRDDLRLLGLIPLNEPYAAMPNFTHIGGESIKSSLLNLPGSNAIVDWVLVELEDQTTNQVVASRSALLQRDGTVVDVDGVSPVAFTASNGNYTVCIRHRNHLCVVSQNTYNFNIGEVTEVDFNNIPVFGEHTLMEMTFGKKAMWGGCPTGNGSVSFQGPNNTPNHLFFEIVTAPGNTTFSPNYINQSVYSSGYLDMNGQIIYQGANSDVNFNFFTIIQHPMNTATQINYTILEQEP